MAVVLQPKKGALASASPAEVTLAEGTLERIRVPAAAARGGRQGR